MRRVLWFLAVLLLPAVVVSAQLLTGSLATGPGGAVSNPVTSGQGGTGVNSSGSTGIAYDAAGTWSFISCTTGLLVGGAPPSCPTTISLTGLTFSNQATWSSTQPMSISGNAGTASVLTPGRTINGTAFDGSTNITVTVPVATGVTGLGTGVATALGVNVDSAGAFVVNGGALGTPASGVATNLTGTAAGLTSGAATALAANPANCSAGNLPRGVDASGVAEGCAAVNLATEVTGSLPVANTDAKVVSVSCSLGISCSGTNPAAVAPTTPFTIAGATSGAILTVGKSTGAPDGSTIVIERDGSAGSVGTLAFNNAGVPKASVYNANDALLRFATVGVDRVLIDSTGLSLATGLTFQINGTQITSAALSNDSSIVKTSRAVNTTSPITGGGDLSTDRTIACATCGVTGSPLSQFAATTSAQLLGVISDETGTGALVFGTSPTITTANLVGTATNNDAAAGSVGEIIVSEVLTGAAVSLTNNSIANVTSVSLTAGDWDVTGNICYNENGSTVTTVAIGWISATSASFPTRPNKGAIASAISGSVAAGTLDQYCYSVGTMRQSLSGSATVYLSTINLFSLNTLSAYGYLRARRIR